MPYERFVRLHRECRTQPRRGDAVPGASRPARAARRSFRGNGLACRSSPHHVAKTMVLQINDFFLPGEGELRDALQAKVRELLDRCDGVAPDVLSPV